MFQALKLTDDKEFNFLNHADSHSTKDMYVACVGTLILDLDAAIVNGVFTFIIPHDKKNEGMVWCCGAVESCGCVNNGILLGRGNEDVRICVCVCVCVYVCVCVCVCVCVSIRFHCC